MHERIAKQVAHIAKQLHSQAFVLRRKQALGPWRQLVHEHGPANLPAHDLGVEIALPVQHIQMLAHRDFRNPQMLRQLLDADRPVLFHVQQ
ncbi:hypothetical protein ABE38_05255 [Brevibacillus agri]|nr:hypothetical protein [Brevibacillus agri]